MTSSKRARRLLAFTVAAAPMVLALPAWAQSAAVDPTTSPADDPASATAGAEAPYRFDGRGLSLGLGPGMVPQEGEAGLATRLTFAFPVAVDWFAIEAGAFGQLFAVTDHHGNRVEVNTGALATGVRFSLPPDSDVRPYAALRFAHVHFFPDPFGEHGHDAGGADHQYHHRWAGGGALGFDVGIPAPTSRFRAGVEAEAYALTGPGIDVIGQVVGVFGIGF